MVLKPISLQLEFISAYKIADFDVPNQYLLAYFENHTILSFVFEFDIVENSCSQRGTQIKKKCFVEGMFTNVFFYGLTAPPPGENPQHRDF